MGDDLDDDAWEGEVEAGIVNHVSRPDEDLASDEGSDDDGVVDEQKLKKKRKLQLLKEKKRMKKLKIVDGDHTQKGDEVVGDEDAALVPGVLKRRVPGMPYYNPEESIQLIISNMPREYVAGFQNLSCDNFVDMSSNWGGNSGNKHKKTGANTQTTTKGDNASTSSDARLCPFVHAVTVAIPSYKKAIAKKGTLKDAHEPGAPLVLIVCASAIRATEITKNVSKILKCRVAKLFAKHIKVHEQMEFLTKQACPIAIGTPNRLNKLIELGALSLRCSRLVLVDNAPDTKSFTILTMNAIKDDFYSFFSNSLATELSHAKVLMVKGVSGG